VAAVVERPVDSTRRNSPTTNPRRARWRPPPFRWRYEAQLVAKQDPLGSQFRAISPQAGHVPTLISTTVSAVSAVVLRGCSSTGTRNRRRRFPKRHL
jgi:hypothetical protein